MAQSDANLSPSTAAARQSPSSASMPNARTKPLLRKRRPLYFRPLFWLALLLGAGVAGGATRGYRIWQATNADLPEVTTALTYQRGGTITLRSADDAILQKIGPASRETVAYDDIPRYLVDAFIASEDQRFYTHQGIDPRGIARALMANLQSQDVVEGASTITQQLTRIVFLDQERTLERKAREALLALKVEQELSKSQILERYLNLVYLGGGAYGVADAAWIYFGKTVEELTLAEAALIAGMAPAPSLYSPIVDPEAARQQRDRVLRRMLATEVISPQAAQAALGTDITATANQPKYLYSEFPYFTIYIQKQLAEILTPDQLEAGGLIVETSLNVYWQRKAEATVQEAIDRYSGWQGFEQVSLVSVDPRNGEIKVMVGGNDFNESQFNRVTQAQRQPGSTFKAFVYTTAIAAGFSPYKGYVDAKYVVDGYEPKNYGGNFQGNVDLLRALRSSINTVAVKLLVDVGFDPVIEMAQKMGIESELLPTYSLALGASEVNLLELTSAYGTLANEGRHVPVHGIRRILSSTGEVIYEAPNQTVQAVDPDTAAIMTWMLRGVVEQGTAGNAALGRPVAGKTGTSERNRDLWFIGYIPQLATGVWMGNDDSSPTYGTSSTAAAVWRMFMVQAIEDLPAESFPDRPSLTGRETLVEAQPVRPGRVTAATSDEEQPNSQAESSPTAATSDAATTTPSSDPTRSQPDPASRPAPAPVSRPAPAPAPGTPITTPPPAAPVAAPAPIIGEPSAPVAAPAAAPVAPPPTPAPAPPPTPAPAAPPPTPAPAAPPPTPAPAAPPPTPAPAAAPAPAAPAPPPLTSPPAAEE